MNVTCQDDNETQVKYNLNLTDVKVIFPKGHDNKIMLTDNTGVIMKYPSFDGFIQGQFAQNKEFDVINVIAESIDQIFQGEEVFDESTTSKKRICSICRKFNKSTIRKNTNIFETAPRLEHSFKVT